MYYYERLHARGEADLGVLRAELRRLVGPPLHEREREPLP